MPSFAQATSAAIATSLTAMIGILEKAEAYCAERKIDQTVLLQSRLFPDMFPLARQIQIASDHARNGFARLAGVEPLALPDTESSFAELRERLQKSIAFVQSIDPAKAEASYGRKLQFAMGPAKGEMEACDHLATYLIPNIYFHLTSAYAILRKAGVAIGKRDFLGNVALTRL